MASYRLQIPGTSIADTQLPPATQLLHDLELCQSAKSNVVAQKSNIVLEMIENAIILYSHRMQEAGRSDLREDAGPSRGPVPASLASLPNVESLS